MDDLNALAMRRRNAHDGGNSLHKCPGQWGTIVDQPCVVIRATVAGVPTSVVTDVRSLEPRLCERDDLLALFGREYIVPGVDDRVVPVACAPHVGTRRR